VRIREQDVLNGCLEWLHLQKLIAFRVNQGMFCDSKGHRRIRATYGFPGVPDILSVIPMRCSECGEKFGVFGAIEVKRPGGKLRADQAVFLETVRQADGVGICVESVKQLEDELRG